MHDPRDVEIGRRAIESGVLDRARALAILERATAERCGFVEAARRLGALDPAREQMLRSLASSGSGRVPSPDAPTVAAPSTGGRRLPAVGGRVGGYVLERVLGQGGMGAVFAGRNEAGMVRAIKIPLFDSVSSAEDRARFEREARALAKVPPHPNVIRVHSCATEGETTYCVLELIEGEGFDKLIERGALPIDRALELAEAVARALAHVHAQGIVHRDVKPANVMLRASDGAPVLMDFGLARDAAERERLTKTGTLVGTPAYMAPEQHEGARDADARADVWAVGVLLYEAIAGERPFEGSTPLEIVTKVLIEEPAPLGKLRAGVPRDVETIVIRALAKDRMKRYPTALALAEDIARARRGEHVLARRPGVVERLGRRLRRAPTRAIAIGAVVLAVAVAVVASALHAQNERRLRTEAWIAEVDGVTSASRGLRREARCRWASSGARADDELRPRLETAIRELERLERDERGRNEVEARAALRGDLALGRAFDGVLAGSGFQIDAASADLREAKLTAAAIAAIDSGAPSRAGALGELEKLSGGKDELAGEASLAIAWMKERDGDHAGALGRLEQVGGLPSRARLATLAHGALARDHAAHGRFIETVAELTAASKAGDKDDFETAVADVATIPLGQLQDKSKASAARRLLDALGPWLKQPGVLSRPGLSAALFAVVSRATTDEDEKRDKARSLDLLLTMPTRPELPHGLELKMREECQTAIGEQRFKDWAQYARAIVKLGGMPRIGQIQFKRDMLDSLGDANDDPGVLFLVATIKLMGTPLGAENDKRQRAARQKEVSDALALVDRALARGLPRRLVPRAHETRGTLLGQLGRRPEALAALQQALDTDHPEPDRVCAIAVEKVIRWVPGPPREAVAWATKTVEYADDLAKRFDEGDEGLKRGRPDGFPLEPESLFDSTLSRRINAREQLVGYLLNTEALDEAEKVASYVDELDQGRPRGHAILAWALLYEGKLDRGRDLLAKARAEVLATGGADFGDKKRSLEGQLVRIKTFLDVADKPDAAKIVLDEVQRLILGR